MNVVFGSSPRGRGTDFPEPMDFALLLQCQRAYRVFQRFWEKKLTSFRPSKSTGTRRFFPVVRKSNP